MSDKNFNIKCVKYVNIDIETLINTVQNYPLLWNNTLKGYKSTNLTNKLWKEVAVLVGFEEGDVNEQMIKELKKMFKAQKDKYRIEHRKVINDTSCPGSEGLPGYESSWPYYALCGFLDVVMTPNSNAEDAFSEDIIEESVGVNIEPECEVTILRPIKKMSKTNDNNDLTIEFEKKKMKVIENSFEDVGDETRNPDLQFLQSLLPYLSGLDIIENMELKSEIMKCVTTFHKQRRTSQ